MDNALQKMYAPYEVPKEILELIKLEEELEKDGLSLYMISLRPIREYFAYTITPLDLIPFADTGGDGIHFGFLTDFGQVKDLQEAPIVCVSPTNDPPVRYMARNIREFFNLVSSVPNAEFLENFWSYDDEAQMFSEIEEIEKEFFDLEWDKKRKIVAERFRDTFGTEVKKVIPYLQEVRERRKGLVAISTLDGLGIVGEKSAEKAIQHFDFQHPLTEKELERMKAFLTQASYLEKLAFIRDVNYYYVVAPGFDEGVLQLLGELLQELNLTVELNRLKWRP